MGIQASAAENGGFTGGGLIAERAYLDLRDRIVALSLPPGTVLREDTLMRELGLGRTPLREAVKRLALEGFVAVRPRRGTYVTDIDVASIVHITEVRATLEGFAAELAAVRMGAAMRETADALLAEIGGRSRGEPAAELMHFDERIHRFVWQAAGNPYLIATLERYFSLSLRVWHLVLGEVPGLGHAVEDLEDLLRAVDARDGARAKALMREHVLDFQREVLAAFSRL